MQLLPLVLLAHSISSTLALALPTPNSPRYDQLDQPAWTWPTFRNPFRRAPARPKPRPFIGPLDTRRPSIGPVDTRRYRAFDAQAAQVEADRCASQIKLEVLEYDVLLDKVEECQRVFGRPPRLRAEVEGELQRQVERNYSGCLYGVCFTILFNTQLVLV